MGDIQVQKDGEDFLKVGVPAEVKQLLIDSKMDEINETIESKKRMITTMRNQKIPQLEAQIVMMELKKAKFQELINKGAQFELPAPNV